MIGVFDSGFGGLTILRELTHSLPEYDFLYLGDNARAPYGSRSFETIHRYTWEAVQYLFAQGCPLVILACNTASARALRTIQQVNLPASAPDRRVLGVLRPMVEMVGKHSKSNHVGILGTQGTVSSSSYPLEIARFWPELHVAQQACPMWVPLVENQLVESAGAEWFVHSDIQSLLGRDPLIDTLVLGCTHYPLLLGQIGKFVPSVVQILNQGEAVAQSTVAYLQRHPEMDCRLSKNGRVRFLTTDTIDHFEVGARAFYAEPVVAQQISLG